MSGDKKKQSDAKKKTIARLSRLGLRTANYDYVVALAGNPNTGKSTIFNALTGLRQHTGNWPGKTIARAEGGFDYNEKRFKIVDLPGTYSLLSASQDEEIARDFILFGRPDVTVVVVDAVRLERNLNLTLQIMQITDRVIVCLNLMDEAKAHGITINREGLEQDLGVPVVTTVARYRKGIDELLNLIDKVGRGDRKCTPKELSYSGLAFHESICRLEKKLEEKFNNLPQARWIALRLLEGDKRVIDAVATGEIDELGVAPT